MRGLRPATSAVCALACACLAISGCDPDGTGARSEGPAPSATARHSTSPAVGPAIARDPRAMAGLIRSDASISAQVRKQLAPCSDNHYPLVTAVGYLTAGDGPDLVVNVTACRSGMGVASYVYRTVQGKYQNVFADEQPPVYGTAEDGRLHIVHEVYAADDPDWYPTGEESAYYAWRAGTFVEVKRSYTDFGGKSPTAQPEPTSTDAPQRPDSDLLDPDDRSGTPQTSATPPTETAGAGR